jgi:two-component system sensor histidine kinase/response regulator
MNRENPLAATLDAAFEQAAAAMLQTDAQGCVLRANAACALLLGCPAELLIGRELTALSSEDDADVLAAQLHALLSSASDRGRLEMRFELEPDRGVWADVALAAQRDGERRLVGLLVCALGIGARKRAEARQLQRHSLALQAAGLGLWEWQVASGHYECDMFWAMTLGYAVSELTPHVDAVVALEHPDDTAQIVEHIDRCLRGETAEYTGEHRLRHKEGHWVWLLDHGMVVERAEHGRPQRVIGTSQDITQRKLAEAALLQSRQRQSLALSSAHLGQWDWDIAAGEVVFDTRFAEIVGYDIAELARNRSTWQLIDHPDDVPMIQARLQAHLHGETESYLSEHRVVHKLGHAVWIHGTGMVVERDAQGAPLRMVGLHKNISERKRVEAELLAAKEAADAANRAKSMFLANMSHEIRTPMNAVIGLTRVVLDTELNPRQRDFLQKVHASSKSLLGILNDILDHSKIEAGRMVLEQIQFPIEEPLNNVASLFGAQLEQKGLELFFEVAPDVPMEVIGDSMRLTQVLNNLVGNAIKFTDAGEIHVKAELAARDASGTLLRFSVSDTGIGLSDAQAASLFQAFTQADNSVTRKYGGTGLGLTISQQLVRLMGGEIGVASAPAKGCVFTFTVRLQPARTEHLSLDLHRVRGLRALVVDDLETSRLIMNNMFDAWGMHADSVATAEEGLQRLEQSRASGLPYDVVLLDWRMPGMDGLEMARRMRAQALPAECPPFAIMVTAFGREQLMSDGGDLPLDVVLTKPVVPSALFDILMRLRHKEGRAAAPPHAAAAGVSSRFDGARVLLVEDNLLNQEVAGEFLHGLGVDVTLANHGGEALARLAAERFDLVLMDMHMPVMDGLSATRRIAELAPAHRPPVVAMTAAVLSEDRAQCAAAGMVDFVAKPVDPDELMQVLRRWLPEALIAPGAALGATSVPTSDASLLPTLDGFDGAAALRRLHGNREQLTRLLRSFAMQQALAAAQIEARLAAGDIAQARHLLHTLKGISATLGLVSIAADARALEAALDGADGPECTHAERTKAASNALAAHLEAAAAAIATLAETPRETSRESGPSLLTLDGAAMSQLLVELRRYVSEQELIPDTLLDELKRIAAGEPPGGPLTALLQHIFDFDNAAALADIERIAAWQSNTES